MNWTIPLHLIFALIEEARIMSFFFNPKMLLSILLKVDTSLFIWAVVIVHVWAKMGSTQDSNILILDEVFRGLLKICFSDAQYHFQACLILASISFFILSQKVTIWPRYV